MILKSKTANKLYKSLKDLCVKTSKGEKKGDFITLLVK